MLIKFHCPNCGQKLRVPDDRGGRKGQCPKCKSTIAIPDSQKVADLLTPAPATDRPEPRDGQPYKLTFLDAPQKTTHQNQPTEDKDESDPALLCTQMPLLGSVRSQPEPTPQRKCPWIIDIFLYPMSLLSLAILALCLVVPLIVRILLLASGPFILITFFPGWLIVILLYVYAFWYFSTCVRQSAEGHLRAPSTIVETPGVWEILVQFFRAIVCLFFFFLPMTIYLGRTQTFDVVFWLLFALGMFLFPMGLLAVTVFDSFTGLNPIFVIGSIFSVLVPYCCIVVVYFGLGFLLTKIGPLWKESRELAYISIGGLFYLLLVAGHLLGRLYFRYQEKLNWQI